MFPPQISTGNDVFRLLAGTLRPRYVQVAKKVWNNDGNGIEVSEEISRVGRKIRA